MDTSPAAARAGDDPGPGDEMAIDPLSVGHASRAWDEQHVDLRAASGQVAHAPTTGFTPRVGCAAADFVRAWAEHTGTAADLSEQQADALRAVLAAWVRTDEAVGAGFFLLLPYLEAQR